MAAVQRKLVHKQFNSPMGLYSPQNVKATLDRELKAFGANGIEIDEHITKPLNLANSAVLRALEEEESEQGGYKRVAWPPVAEDRLIKEFTPQPQSALQQQQYTQPQVTPSGAVPNQSQAYCAPSAPIGQSYDRYQQHQQPQGIHHSPVPQYNQQQPHQPLVAGHQPSQQSIKPSAGLLYKAPQQQQQQQQQPQVQQQQQQPQYHRQSEPSESPYNYYSQPPQQQPQHPSLQEGSYPQQYRGESPGIITLRKEAPITQKPSPVYTSQPAAAKYQGGTNMRGDLKWPPPEYKEQAAVENEARRQLAAGPVCRPRRINKDYTQFFAKNALNSYYPGYKVPPGTQHMIN